MLDAILGFDINAIGKGNDIGSPSTTDVYTEAELPGLKEESSIARIQWAFIYNTTNSTKRPTSGGLLSVKSGIFNDIENNKFGFWKLSASYMHYIHLFYERTISLRVAAETTEKFSGETIPFYYLSELGESETIRGFKRGRFRDKAARRRAPRRLRSPRSLREATGDGRVLRRHPFDHLGRHRHPRPIRR